MKQKNLALILTWVLCSLHGFAQDAKPPAAAPPTAAAAPTAAATPPATAPTTPAPAAPKPARNIRFQFDGIPYSDVVERFAQMTGKPLLADTNVVGTLTFNDPNAYTYEEALDTLNLMLAMKGVMLMDEGNHLQLVPFKQLPAQPHRILRGTDHTGDVRPGEIVTVVLDVKNVDSKEIADSVTAMLSNAGSLAPLSRGRGLIVTDRLANIQRIRTLLATIDTEATVDRQMKTYTLLHSSGTIIADLLNRTFGIATAPKRTTFNPNSKAMEVLPADPNDYITAVYDDASRTLVLFGPNERLALAEDLINRFEQKDGAGGDVRIYYPQTIKADELANLVRQAIPGIAAPNETAATASTKARLIADLPQNRLIVAAPVSGQLDEIEQLINRVDKPVHGAGATGAGNVPIRSQSVQLTRIFRPRATEATNVAHIVTQALTRRSPGGQNVTTASVSFDAGSQSVVVTGTTTDIQIATDIVAQLETGTTQPTALQTRFIDVGSPAEAKRLQPLVEQLYRNQVSDGTLGAVAHAKIMADADAGRLIVTASDDHLSRIEELVRQLRTDKPLPQARRLQVFALKNVRTDTALAGIQNLVNDRMTDRRYSDVPKPSLVADPQNNRLLVTATDDQLKDVEQIITVIDTTIPASTPREFRGIELFSRTTAEFTPLVQQLYQEQLKGQPEPAGGAATLIAETKNNRIMVSGSTAEIARVEAIIRQLDPAERRAAKDETRVIRLHSANAAELVGLIEKSLNAQQQTVRVLLDARSNSLVVTGDTSSVEAASKIIDQLDTRANVSPREIRILELKSSDAATLGPMLNNLFTELVKDQRGAEYVSPTKIVPDATGNRIVVTGVRDEIEQIAGLVRKLDNAPEQAPNARVFKLNSADAVVMAPIVSSAMMRYDPRGQAIKRVTVTADEKSNSLIVSGTRADLQDAESVIEKLDGGEVAGKERIVRIFEVKSDADAIATLAGKVFAAQNPGRNTASLISITPDPSGKRVIILAPVTMMAQIETMITSLDAKPDQGVRELQAVELKNATAAELLPKVTQIYNEQSQGKTLKPATLYADASGTRLLVQGTAEQAASIRQIVDTLQSQTRAPRETRVFDLGKLAEAQRVLPLAQQFYKDQLVSNPQLGSADAQMVTDGRTGRLIVSARADQMKSIEEIISRLQVTSGTNQPGRETKTIEVGTAADVERLRPLVQQLYQDQWKDRLETDPADAQIMADPRAGRIIVTGKPEHLKQIEVILQQLGTGKAKPEARTTRIFDLTTASAVELAATVRTLYTEQAKSRLGSQAPDTLITPDAGGNRLIVVGDAMELDAIEGIVKQLDKVSAQSASARVFKIKSADPDKVAEILTSSLVRYDAYGRPQKRATVSVDAKTRTLIVTGDPKELQGVSVIIEQLDQSLGAQPERKMRVITLKQGRATTLAAKVRQLYTDRVKSQPELATSEILILEESDSNQLILAGSEAQLGLVDQIVTELQAAQTAQSARETKLLELGSTEEMTRLLPLVQQLYQDRWKSRNLTDPPDAKIIPDEKNARLIVTARTNHIAEIESILAQLRTGTPAAEGRDTRIFDLTTANAMELSATVRTLYTEQARTRPGAPAADTLILPDANANRIIVTAATNELAVVEDIIKKLDKVGAQSATTRVFKLKSADPDKIVEILGTALVRYDAYGRPQKRVSVVTDSKTRTLIATGDSKELQSASIIIEQLDSSLGTDAGRTMRVLAVKSRRSTELAAKVRQLYQDRAKGEPDLSGAEPLILDDSASSQLILAGNAKQLDVIEEITVLLETASADTGRDVRVIPLERNSASAISSLLSQIYVKQIASTDPGERVVFGSGGNDRTLVVDAPTPVFEKIAQVVKSLDQTETGGQNVIQTVHLTKGRAEDVADAVNRSITNRTAPGVLRRSNAMVTAVSGANTLLINGPTNVVQDVLRIVRELDQEGGGGSRDIEVRIYKLENGSAREVSTVLQQLMQTVSRQLRGDSERPIPASVSVDERSNSLIVSATQAHFKVIEKILPTLDKAPERSDRDVQFVWLRKAKAYDVSSKLETLFESRPSAERPVIEPDITNNSLTIIAKRGDIAQIQDLVSRLDEQSKDSTVQVRLRALERVTAEQMAKMLENIYPQVSRAQVRVVDKVEPPKTEERPPKAPDGAANPTTPPAAPQPAAAPAPAATPAKAAEDAIPTVVIAVDKAANALILSGPAQELDNVDRLVTELSFNFYGNESEFRLFPLKDADPVIVSRALSELLKQEPVALPTPPGQPPRTITPQSRITVVAEPRTRSVIVRARPTDFPLMESLIKQLDSTGQTAQLDFRVVPLTNAPPDKVLPLVQQLVTQLNVARPGEPVTVAADPRSHGVLVVARGSVLEQVEKMVRSFDKPADHVEAEVLIVPLKKANAGQLATVLQGMLKPGAQGEATAEARELQDQVRTLKIQNDSGTAVTLDLTRPIKIAADAAGPGGGNRLILTSTPDNLKALAAVVELMDTTAIAEGVGVKIVKLQNADAATVSQTLTSIFTQGRQLAAGPAGPGAQPEGQAGKALVNPLTVAIDARSNTLILSGQAETLELAQKVVTDLDKPVDRFLTDVRLFRLKHASATRLLPLLQSVFAEGPPVAGTEGLNTQVTRLRTLKEAEASKTNQVSKARAALVIQADDLSNILIVAARSDSIPLIQDVIEQLDIPAASGLETVRIYPLNHADPVAVQRILNDLYAGQRAGTIRAEDKPVISIDERTGALVVAGNSKAFGMIEGLLMQLDQQLPFELRDIRLVPLESADANVVAPTLQKLMDARLTQRASLNKGQADALKVVVMADQRSNALLVGGSKDGFELVESLAKQLDKASPALGGRIRLVPLQFADARVVAATMTTLFEQRYAAARTADVQRNKPIILPDARSNSLLVAASQDDNGVLDDLLKKLDAKQDNPALTLTVLPLKHNDSGRVATMIESIFASRQRAQTLPGQTALPSDGIKLEPDSLNNALIVSSSKENLELIQSLVEKLDQEPAVPGGVFETFTLEFADAQRIATILKSLVTQGLYRPGLTPGAGAAKSNSQRDLLSVTVDPRSNTLIVSASPENLAIVKEVIKKVDTKDLAARGDVRLYPLKNAKASTLATILEQFFRAKQTADTVAVNANERMIPASVIADDRVNTLLVTGGKEAFDVVDRILPQLDGDGVFSRLNFRVFPLKKATASKLQSTLQPIFANRPPKVKGEPLDPITIVADRWVNALLVGASVEDMTTVASLIEQLDTDATDAGLAIHVFPLLKADARRVATTVQGLFRENLPNQTVPIQISADERINALVVSCGEADAKRIGELVQRLDTDQVARVSEIKVFPLQFARAETLSTILNTALNTRPTGNLTEENPNAQSVLQFITRTDGGKELVTAALKEAVLITPDARMNSLIVSGPVDYMGLLDQIVSRLDASSPQQAKIKVFALQNADARQMAEVLTQLFRMTQTAGAAGQRSVQYTLMRPRLDESGMPLEDVALASATIGNAEQNALTVTIDPRTNSLLIGGTDHYVTLVSEIIESLDATPANERKTEVVRLKNSQSQDVAQAIRTFLDQERQRVTQVLGAEAIGTAQKMLEHEVAVVAEQTSNTLLVSANPRYFEQIRAMIDELDKAQPQVLIQVMLAEVTLDGAMDLGVEWNYHGSDGDVKYGIGTDFGVADALKNFGGFSTAVTGSDFSFLIRALKNDGRLEVLSRPQIVTADNKPATINIGQRVPLITDSRVTAQGDTINSFRYEDVGVNLSVTPKISLDGFVKMEIGTTNSALSSSSVEINRSATVPIINQRKASTTVSVQSGQTIIIGGLIASLDDKRVKKMPILGDIPFLGVMFRTTSHTHERKELLILLTPQVIASSQGVVPLRDMDELTRQQILKSGLKEGIKRDGFKDSILEPVFGPSTNVPPIDVLPKQKPAPKGT